MSSRRPPDVVPSAGATEPAGDPPGSVPGAGPLKASSARGFLWTGGQALFNRGLSLVGFVVLARLLGPHDYGLVAIANVFVLLLQMLAAAGFSSALVQRPEVDRLDFDTVFWIGLGLGILLAGALATAAGPLAGAFDEPDLEAVLRVLSLTFVFVAVGSPAQAVLLRRMEFKRLAAATMAANVLATVVGIAFALAGFGVWALVAQTLVGTVATSAGIIALSGYRPAPHVSMARLRSLFASSRNFLGTTLMTYLNQRADDFLIGSVLGPGVLGIYVIAYRTLTIMQEVLATSALTVAFPVFARVQEDVGRLLRAYLSAMRVNGVVAFPCYAICFAAAPEIIDVVFGPKWADSVPVMRILCLFGALESVVQFNYALLQSIGRVGTVFRITVGETVLQVVGFAIAVRYGIEWVAASYVIRAYLTAPIGLVVASRQLETSLWATLAGLVAPLLSSVLAAAAVFAMRALIGAGAAAPVTLLVLIATAAGLYLVILRLIGRSHVAEVREYLRSAVARRAASRGV